MATDIERELGISLAAGGVVVREGWVLLVHRPRYGDWSFPKGKREVGERLEETAEREVREETGYGVRVGEYLGAVSYEVGGEPKVVLYWGMEVTGGGDGEIDKGEVDEVAWVELGEAAGRLTYSGEREMLSRINEMRNSGEKGLQWS